MSLSTNNPLGDMLALIPVLTTVLDPKLLQELQLAYFDKTHEYASINRIMEILFHLQEYDLVSITACRLENVGGEVYLIKKDISNGG